MRSIYNHPLNIELTRTTNGFTTVPGLTPLPVWVRTPAPDTLTEDGVVVERLKAKTVGGTVGVFREIGAVLCVLTPGATLANGRDEAKEVWELDVAPLGETGARSGAACTSSGWADCSATRLFAVTPLDPERFVHRPAHPVFTGEMTVAFENAFEIEAV